MITAIIIVGALIMLMVCLAIDQNNKQKYMEMERKVLKELGFVTWYIVPKYDDHIIVKSRKTLDNYDFIKYFKEDKDRIIQAEKTIEEKIKLSDKLNRFLKNNDYKSDSQYYKISNHIDEILRMLKGYKIQIECVSAAGNHLGCKEIIVTQVDLNRLKNDPSLLMSKTEYNKYLKEKQKEELLQKQHDYYCSVNELIDYANTNRDLLIIKKAQDQLDNLAIQLFDRTVNSIKKIKSLDSEEWTIIGDFIEQHKKEIHKIVQHNKKILAYYNSEGFVKIKETCESLMSSQREFNEYISEKVKSVSDLFGTRVVRNETVNEDEYDYIRPYKKTITPFTAEVSATVFASAENNPMEYIIKYFYPNKKEYPEQIQKLSTLIEELETLKEAKQIIENYKAEYNQYLEDVPEYIMNDDEEGFYSRLGFANISEHVLTVEYKFSYTSNGGMAKRSFTVPMTEETITELIHALENKLRTSSFVKEQRTLMTKKLREYIKKRDDYTCCNCKNSTYKEPNLLLEIDHIIPVSKGGRTEEENLQTLCWKCNRSKSNKIINV